MAARHRLRALILAAALVALLGGPAAVAHAGPAATPAAALHAGPALAALRPHAAPAVSWLGAGSGHDASAGINATCTLSADHPSIVKLDPDPNGLQQAQVHFSASMWCDAPGTVELTVVIERLLPGGTWSTVAWRGPVNGAGLGVRTQPGICAVEVVGTYRGWIRPRFLGDNGLVCDFGWWYTTPPKYLSC